MLGGISALQFEAVRLACERHSQTLPDGSKAGFFLGDGEIPYLYSERFPGSELYWTSLTGPGVGKGRQVAALILENFLQGRTKVVQIWSCHRYSGHLTCDYN